MTIEELLADLTKRLYFVNHIQQNGPSWWTVSLSSATDWYYRRGEGSTLLEALDKARTEALKPPPKPVPAKVPHGRVRLTSPRRKRVKLTSRVRLK